MHVVAKREVVLARVAARAKATGRHVPIGEIDDSITRVPQSVRELAPLADFIAVVDNSGSCPRLVECCDREACQPADDEWEQISRLVAPADDCLVDDWDEGGNHAMWRQAFGTLAGDYMDI